MDLSESGGREFEAEVFAVVVVVVVDADEVCVGLVLWVRDEGIN